MKTWWIKRGKFSTLIIDGNNDVIIQPIKHRVVSLAFSQYMVMERKA